MDIVINKKIAIRGSSKDGKKIIQYLENLGGKKSLYKGNDKYAYYFIRNDNFITCTHRENPEGYTLLEKIPENKIYELW